MATSDLQSYRILLVGQTGSGKSSTGNSILDKNVFKSRKPNESSDGDVIACYSSVVDGRYVFVMDGTGIGGTGMELNGGVTSLLQLFDSTMKHEMSCFNAIVLVHYIHERSQINMKSSLLEIQSIFGRYAFKHWGIIVVTFGDQFDVNNLDDNIHSFEDWCQQQTGYFKTLLKECNNRCVLFDNKTTDKIKQIEQRNRLMSVVDSITYKNYTRNDFDSPTCKLSRQQLILLEEVNRKLEYFDSNETRQHGINKQELNILLTKLLEHKQQLATQKHQSKFAAQLMKRVTEALNMLQIEIGDLFEEGEQKLSTQSERSDSFLFKYEKPTNSLYKHYFSLLEDEPLITKLRTSASVIQGDKQSNAKAARERRQVLKIPNGTQMPTVLLVGRSGNGKSSVGNSILGEHKFKLKSIPESQHAHNEVSMNLKVRVVDCTGIAESIYEMLDDVKSVIKSAREAVQLCHPGVDALIYVLKYGIRFTKQEKDAIQLVKSIFGENVLRDWGILVFSYGDNFYMDTEDDDITFQDWCREQTGDIKDLFQGVDYRCFTFDNKTRDAEKQRKQRKELMRCVEKIQDNKRRCYSLSDFESREVLIVGEEVDQLKAKTEEIIRKMNQSLKRKPVPRDHEIQLETVLQELQQHAQELKEKDRNTGIL